MSDDGDGDGGARIALAAAETGRLDILVSSAGIFVLLTSGLTGEGFPEWRAAGFPIGQGDAPARPLAS